MNAIKFVLFYPFFLISTFSTAQNLKGVWEGTLLQGLKPFTFKLFIQQINKTVSGESYIADKNGKWGRIVFKAKIKNDTLFYQENEIQSQRPGPNQWCIKSGLFIISKDFTTISGNWKGNCTPGTVEVKKVSIVDSLHTDTSKELIVEDGLIVPIPKREIKKSQKIILTKKIIKIAISDDRETDNDSVTVIFNDEVILKNFKLSHKSKNIVLNYDSTLTENKLILFAENLGQKPPNTAKVTIKNGKKTYIRVLHSNLKENDCIIFVFKK